MGAEIVKINVNLNRDEMKAYADQIISEALREHIRESREVEKHLLMKKLSRLFDRFDLEFVIVKTKRGEQWYFEA